MRNAGLRLEHGSAGSSWAKWERTIPLTCVFLPHGRFIASIDLAFTGTSTRIQYLATLSPGRRHYLDQVPFPSGHLPPLSSDPSTSLAISCRSVCLRLLASACRRGYPPSFMCCGEPLASSELSPQRHLTMIAYSIPAGLVASSLSHSTSGSSQRRTT